MSVLERNQDVLLRRHEGALTLIFDENVFKLNEVGERVWKLVDGSSSSEEIAAQICSEYEAQEDDVRGDVEQFIAMLVAEGLLTTN